MTKTAARAAVKAELAKFSELRYGSSDEELASLSQEEGDRREALAKAAAARAVELMIQYHLV